MHAADTDDCIEFAAKKSYVFKTYLKNDAIKTSAKSGAQVKSSLLSHRSTSAIKTKVETTESIVTLSGIAMNAAAKSLVTKLVEEIGVSKVINNMTIAAPVATN